MPSACTPMDVFETPNNYGYEDLSIPIPDLSIVEHLRSLLPEVREEAYRFVDAEFGAAAEKVYTEIGKPALNLETGWKIFGQMRGLLHVVHDNSVVY